MAVDVKLLLSEYSECGAFHRVDFVGGVEERQQGRGRDALRFRAAARQTRTDTRRDTQENDCDNGESFHVGTLVIEKGYARAPPMPVDAIHRGSG
jgi:hypothetical protein